MISEKSRYSKCVILQNGMTESLTTRKRIPALPRYDDRFHTVVDGDRIDNLAFYYFDDASLWWIIADYNDISFPLELPVGNVLRIPSVEFVRMRMSNS